MDRIANVILKRKKTVIVAFLVAAALCTVLQFFVTINYDMKSYLPKEAPSTQALAILEEEFPAPMPNASVMLRNVSVTQALDYKQRLRQIAGVQDVMWLDDVADLQQPVELIDAALLETYYKDGNALLSVSIDDAQAVAATDAIYECIGEDHALTGDALSTASSQKMAATESRNAILVILPIILLILFLSTSSWVEPIFFLATIGVSVLINMGSNLFMGEISFITQAISPILQLAVSMDYAIFLLHSFTAQRKTSPDVETAMRRAMRQSLPAVAASALTTLFGFLALVFMKFRIGPDLGLNLAKGILLSLLSVMVFLPAFTVCFYKWIDKTQHRSLMPKFEKLGKAVGRSRIPALVLLAVLLVPAFLGQRSVNFSYGVGDASSESRIGMDAVAVQETFGQNTAVVLFVPKGDVAKEAVLCDALAENTHVTAVVSYANTVGNTIPVEYLDESISRQFYSDNYCRIILYTDTPEEGDLAFGTVEWLKQEATQHYDEVYMLGQSANLYDMKLTVERDNQLVNLIAIIAIGLVIAITFRSLSLPVVLLLTIESAIWINLAIPYFMESTLNFIGFLVINTVQLGATVDYAILLTDHYREARKRLPIKQAMYVTVSETFPSILVSASILAAAGFCLFFISSNPIVSELGLLLGRGTLLSFLMVLFVLPALMTFGDIVIRKTTWGAKDARPNDDNSQTERL